MKYTLLITLFITAILRGGAQVTITLTPDVVNTTLNADSFEVRAKATLKNTSTVTKKFTWTRTIKKMTAGWACLVCDKNTCWASTVSTPLDQIELAAGATSNIDVYIRPDKKLGAANVEVQVYEVGNSSNTVTGLYNFLTTTSTRTRDLKDNGTTLRIYPNPAVDFFQITDNDLVEKVVIYNIIGRQMRSYKAVEGMKYTVNDLPDGLYIIRLLSGNGATVKTVRLSKLRPKA
jgi:Secretion system C-terminal sorting domain